MAVALFHKKIIRIKNKVVIKNNKEENKPPTQDTAKPTGATEVNARIRGRMYGRRTINRQN